MSKVKRADVAREAGVAESTVTRALNNSSMITDTVKARVRDAALKLGYIPNKQASYFARNRTNRLGLVVRAYRNFPPFSRHYFPKLLDGVVLRAEELGYSVNIVLDRKHDGSTVDFVHFVKSREVDGLLFSVTRFEDPRFQYLTNAEIPFVLINNHQQGMTSVDGDPYPGMKEAFELARSEGHDHAGYISGDQRYLNGSERLDAFNRLCREFDFRKTLVQGDFSRTRGFHAAEEILNLKSPPTIIFTANDRTAFGVMEYCRKKGISIPGDLSLIGYDNLGPVEEIQPPLTTIDNCVSPAGREAVTLLVNRLEGRESTPVRKILPSRLIIRESVGPCKK